jgi:methyl-accepting chemotaxis protein
MKNNDKPFKVVECIHQADHILIPKQTNDIAQKTIEASHEYKQVNNTLNEVNNKVNNTLAVLSEIEEDVAQIKESHKHFNTVLNNLKNILLKYV